MNIIHQLRTYTALALLLAIANSGLAGAVNGPRANVDTVRAYVTDVYHITFRAEELARVYISGDGDTDLDLYIYDANGNLVAFDDDDSDTCLGSWVPRWTGTFRIEIKNRGGLANRYVLRTN